MASVAQSQRQKIDLAPIGDVDGVFRVHRAMCIARNYSEIPESLDDLMPGTQATIRDAAMILEEERREARRLRSRTITMPSRRDPHATMAGRRAG